MLPIPDITVCICTFKRPALLQKLLHELVTQETQNRFTYSVVVTDNDAAGSARDVVTAFSAAGLLKVHYTVEREQNIARARNRAVSAAQGQFIAFIDDDEFPASDWLLNLFQTCSRNNVDGVLGPVKPYFETPPPKWIVKGRFYERPTHHTGFIIDWNEGRTGNVLFKRAVFDRDAEPFQPEFGSGGEDRNFFKRAIAAGRVFMWCDEAVAFEVVPPVRWKRSFMLKRALLRGKVSLVDPASNLPKVVRSALAVPAYSLALPFLLITGHHKFMKYLVKTFDHLGRLFAFVGLDVVKEKYVTE